MHRATRTNGLSLLAIGLALATACNVYTPDLVESTDDGSEPEPSGGEETGGSDSGGRPTGGGGATGGQPSGGGTTGGQPSGGAPTGGDDSGGAPTGGTPDSGGTGGAPPSGGTGARPTGGAPPGGGSGGSQPLGGAPGGGAPGGAPPDGGAPPEGGAPPDGGSGGAPPDGGGGGAPPEGGTGGDAGGATAGGSGGSGTGGAVVDPDLIDDFEANNSSIVTVSGRQGYWYTFTDGSAGTITPAEGASVRPTALDPPRDQSTRALHVVCSEAFTSWGAGFGFDLANKRVYDASAYAGVRFWVRSGDDFTGDHPELSLRVKTADIVKTADNSNGTCPPSDEWVAADCDNAHQALFPVTADWTEVSVAFAELAQEDWGYQVAFDPTRAIAVQFQVPADVTFDVWIDDVRLYAE
ncbi:MAG TPA: hypothetical protein PLU22_12145 [Polyangiaceae bacterium]|nr:hypothetical protein [Polyangiaceae bacterium]